MTEKAPQQPLIYQCPSCHVLTVLGHFSTTKEGLSLTCLVCQESTFFPNPTLHPEAVINAASGALKLSVKEDQVHASIEPLGAAEVATTSKVASAAKDASSLPVEADAKEDAALSEAAPAIAAPQEAPRSPEADEKRCPKCSQICKQNAKDCPRCGLHFANVGVTFDPERMTTPQNPIEAKALELWEEIETQWDQSAHHDRYIQYCHLNDLLEMAAFHYRKVKDEDAARAASAAVYLNRIIELVQQQFLSQQSKSTVEETVQKGKWALMIGLLVLGLMAFYVIWRATSGSFLQTQLP